MKQVTSQTDFNTIHNVLVKQPNNSGKNLGQGISNAVIVNEKEMDKKTIRLNSFVEIQNTDAKKIVKMQIVMPDFADVKERRISVFAPISVALMGFKEKDTISWKINGQESNFKILHVVND